MFSFKCVEPTGDVVLIPVPDRLGCISYDLRVKPKYQMKLSLSVSERKILNKIDTHGATCDECLYAVYAVMMLLILLKDL